ncbi:hypothetical protein [Enterococcus faecalis]|uniref:hypothetical protein n=1 Tax=Enterococcus faecalis TaxID=1351 RepID=UPI00338E401C
MTGTHLNKLGTQQKKRIYFEVSKEAAKNKRYYPAHTMEKLIRDRHELLKAFGD